MMRTAQAPTPDFETATLDRGSFIPLYYQLQELLKQQIESGRWAPGDVLPSEPELCRQFGVSRMVVRQALAILGDDRQVIRQRGRGTFVARPKVDYRAGGLVRLLAAPSRSAVAIDVLDVSAQRVETSIRRRLGIGSAHALRITTQISLRDQPIAISYSYFDRTRVEWLERLAVVATRIPDDVTLADHGIKLGRSDVSIETSQCGQFEADCFGIPHRSAVFLVLATEYALDDDGHDVPLEVARCEYRGDILQFRLELSAGPPSAIAATLALSRESGLDLAAR